VAQDWIKVCKDTPNKRELAVIATRMGATKAEVFLWWFSLYAWADSQTADGMLPHMSTESLAHAAGVPLEFCVMLGSEEVAWVYEAVSTAGVRGIVFSHWDRHNGKSAKRRAMEANKKQCRRRTVRK